MPPSPRPDALVRRFYEAFEALDAAAMQACYAADARFRDEVFDLEGRDAIGAMWGMLCEAARQRGRDQWALEARDIVADADVVSAHWEPRYRFGARGRAVHNRIDATLVVRDGLIVEHVDRFDFWRWSRQALGPLGWALGWTPWLRAKVRQQARGQLARWQRDRNRGAAAAGSPP